MMDEAQPKAGRDKFSNLYFFLKKLLKENVPIHEVGFQAHVYEEGERINPKSFKNTVNLFNQ